MKKSIVLLLTLILAISILQFGVSASENIYVTVDGATLNFDQPPIMQNDRVLVPMRLIFEVLGATVEWDNNSQTVKAVKGETYITMQIGNNIMMKNGIQIPLDTAPILLNERTLVPVRAVAESLDATVEWRGDINTVVIEQKATSNNYITENVVYAPNARSIITDKENNIYYIQDNKVMIYKNGIASVFVDISKDYADIEIDNSGEREQTFRIAGICYDPKRDTILAGMRGTEGYGTGIIVDLKSQNILAKGKDMYLGKLMVLNNDTVYMYDSKGSEYGICNLSTGHFARNRMPDGIGESPHSIAVIDNKLCLLDLNLGYYDPTHYEYTVNYYQYDPSKDTFIKSTLHSFVAQEYSVYIGTDGINFYFTQEKNIYQVTPTMQINLWLNCVESNILDNNVKYVDLRFTFDQEGNILFYDEDVKSIRRIKKLN